MTDEIFEKAILRVQRIAEVVGKLPPELRVTAFESLAGFIPSTTTRPAPPAPADKSAVGGGKTAPPPPVDTSDREAFFGAFNHDKPADNARLLIAWLYSQYGTESFTVAELRELASEVGLTIPERLDMTIKSAREDGKTLYTSTGRGKFKPTVHGEASLKAEYSIRKGTAKKPGAAE